MNITGRINAFRVIERLEGMNILGGQNNESIKAQPLPLTTRLARDTKISVNVGLELTIALFTEYNDAFIYSATESVYCRF